METGVPTADLLDTDPAMLDTLVNYLNWRSERRAKAQRDAEARSRSGRR